MKKKINIICLLLLLALTCVFGQMKIFGFKRELLGVKDSWHRIVLPNGIFEKISNHFTDIRIFGTKEGKADIEVPYILKVLTERYSQIDVKFNLLNQSKNENGYFYTFEVPTNNAVNQIRLDFKLTNFDWKLTLEGSQNQKEWFSVVEGYRILSIKNDHISFQFAKIHFPNSKYQFYRLNIDSKIDPEFLAAKLSLDNSEEGNIREYEIEKTETVHNKKEKETYIFIDFKTAVPVYKLKVNVVDKFDFYRPITIQYLSNKVKTLQGWDDYYTTLASGTLNSMEGNEFKFNSTVIKKIKITIDNQDNEPLNIGNVKAFGYVYELIARFSEPANYYLTYDNHSVGFPNYDISHFAEKVPKSLTLLELGEESLIEKAPLEKPSPPLFDQNTLWALMVIIIIILGWFSLKMIRQKEEE